MSYVALYRKWRPLSFTDVVGQEHIVKTLKNSVSTGHISHAYLFCGTRGTGKTTIAKILSRAINCLSPTVGEPCNQCEICKKILSNTLLDVIEIDAASNNGVDNIREICDEVVYTPSEASYKVYIIDEVHMLSTGAFNALLKTLEEPPPHAVFILATTEPHKLPATILSRCQRFDFTKIPTESMSKRLLHIANATNINLDQDAAEFIANTADGALRDALSLLDQCISAGITKITYKEVLDVVGAVDEAFISEVVGAVETSDIKKILKMISDMMNGGKDISVFISEMIVYYRNLLVYTVCGSAAGLSGISEKANSVLIEQCKKINSGKAIAAIKELSFLESSLKLSAQPRILLEVSLIKLASKIEKYEATANDSQKPTVSKTTKVLLKPEKEKTFLSVEGEFSEWEQVLNELKQTGKMMLYANLSGTKAVKIREKLIGVVFKEQDGFNKMFASRAENIELLETIIDKKYIPGVSLKCVSGTELDPKGAPKTKEENKLDDIAKKLNIPINIIEE